MTGGLARALIAAVCLTGSGAALAQDATVLPNESMDQILVDLDALIIGTSATLRCSVYDTNLPYLSPLEAAGAEIRLRQLESALSPTVEDLADRMAEMRAEAANVTCGNEGLLPFLEFSREAGEDVVDIGISAWQTIRFETCSYFADDDFLAAVARARRAADAFSVSGDPARVAYIAENAALWSELFAENCFNLAFDPTQTIPGQIALALPAS